MKQFFLESGADVVRAIESEIEAMASSDRRLLHQHRRSVAPGGATSSTIAGSGSGSLAYLSILLGLVEQQLVHPKNLVPVSTSRGGGHESRHNEDQDEEEGDDESLLRLKTDDEPHEQGPHDDDDEPEEEDDEHEVDFCLPNPIPFSR